MLNPLKLPVAVGDFVYRQRDVPVFRGARGAFLYDTEGRRYLDAEASNGAVLLGYDEGLLQRACTRMAGLPSLPAFCESELRLELATRLGHMLSEATGQVGRLAFALGGAQGVELAMRVVRGSRPDGLLAVFEGGYHGRSMYTAELSASQRYREKFPSVAERVVRLPYPDCEQCRFGRTRQTCAHECVSFVRAGLACEYSGMGGTSNVAALVVEPLLSAGGVVKPDRTYLDETVRAFRERGALIVVDETFTGLYRTGPTWGFQHYGFVPDIVVFAKGLTNGLVPLSCVWARDPLMLPPAFPPGTHSSTFTNNVMAMSVANVVLDRLAAWQTRESDLQRLEDELNRIMVEAARRSRCVRSGYALGGAARLLLEPGVRCGHVMGVARSIGRLRPTGDIAGLILAGSGLAENVVAVNPPLNIEPAALAQLEHLLFATLSVVDDEVARGDAS